MRGSKQSVNRKRQRER